MKNEQNVQVLEKPKQAAKTEKGIKNTNRVFQSRNEAIQAATEAKRKGMPVSIGIERGGYKLI